MGINRSAVEDLLVVPVRVSQSVAGAGVAPQVRGGRPSTLARLIVDTGSRYCNLKPEFVDGLGLSLVRPIQVHTHTGQGATGLYEADMSFPGGTLAPLRQVLVARLPMPEILKDYDGVIGRRVLRRWYTLYGGPPSRLTIRDTPSLGAWLFS
jgi:hypothetical protein